MSVGSGGIRFGTGDPYRDPTPKVSSEIILTLIQRT